MPTPKTATANDEGPSATDVMALIDDVLRFNPEPPGPVYTVRHANLLATLWITGESLFGQAVELALDGPWRKQDDTFEVECPPLITAAALRATNLRDINIIMDAWDAVQRAHELLSRSVGSCVCSRINK